MKKYSIILTSLVFATVASVSAEVDATMNVGTGKRATSSPYTQPAPRAKPIMVPGKIGDAAIDAKLKALHEEYQTKLKALHDDYQAKMKAIIGERKIVKSEQGSSSIKMMNGRPMEDMKHGEDNMKMQASTSKRAMMMREGSIPKGQGVRGEATTTVDGNTEVSPQNESNGFRSFFQRFFNR